MFHRNENNFLPGSTLKRLLVLAAVSVLIPSAKAAETAILAPYRDRKVFKGNHALFKTLPSSIDPAGSSSLLKFTCPDSKTVENLLNENWDKSNCDIMGSRTSVEFNQVPNPYESMAGTIAMNSCHPGIGLASNYVELDVYNQTCVDPLGRTMINSYAQCGYKVISNSSNYETSAIQIGCFYNHTGWFPKEGYFALQNFLFNSSTCNKQNNTFLCQRDIPLDPMTGVWRPLDGLYPYFNFNNVNNTLQYTISVLGADQSTCCEVNISAYAALDQEAIQDPYPPYTFELNAPSTVINIENKTAVCGLENISYSLWMSFYGIWLQLKDNNTMQVSTHGPEVQACNLSTTLTRIQEEDTRSMPSIKPGF
ncbi:MAG TPA: hypothetical protein VLJ15_08165 [Gammaproteobacteria bacterium]|nr:hypothetical protein [Gammaproteobacteria bacterium]